MKTHHSDVEDLTTKGSTVADSPELWVATLSFVHPLGDAAS